MPCRDFCFLRKKDQVGTDVYIDDSPDNIEALRAAGHYAIRVANSANRGIEAPKARNWEQVYKLIKERHPEPVVVG